jgi:hypothetical protein
MKARAARDDAGHKPPLQTEADWIKAGEIVFEAPITSGEVFTVVRAAEWYEKSGMPVNKDGTLSF